MDFNPKIPIIRQPSSAQPDQLLQTLKTAELQDGEKIASLYSIIAI
jgi:hypothetical protein